LTFEWLFDYIAECWGEGHLAHAGFTLDDLASLSWWLGQLTPDQREEALDETVQSPAREELDALEGVLTDQETKIADLKARIEAAPAETAGLLADTVLRLGLGLTGMKARRDELAADVQAPGVVVQCKRAIDPMRKVSSEELYRLRLALRSQVGRLVDRISVVLRKDTGGCRVADVTVQMRRREWRRVMLHSRKGVLELSVITDVAGKVAGRALDGFSGPGGSTSWPP
jgi:hypothetical protein